MARSKIRCIGILTAGGDCPGLNAVIRAVVKSANFSGMDVVGIQDGFRGLVEKNMKVLAPEDVSNILTLGGTILGSSNKDNPFHMPVTVRGKARFRDCASEIPQSLRRLGIQALVILGGNGSMTVAHRLARMGVKIVGVPKTIDNDLEGTDQTFGYDTAVSVASEAIDRLHTVAASHHRVMVVEVMGRNAGWLALGAGMASGGDIILLPELPYDEWKVAETIHDRRKRGKKSSIVVIAEGAHPKGGGVVLDRPNPRSKGRIRLGGVGRELAHHLETKSGIETRSVVLGHIVRGGTPTAFDRKLATLFGVHALELVKDGRFGRMVSLKNQAMDSVPLETAAGKTRIVPKDHEWVLAAKRIGVDFGV
ncbi:MAG TPA: ATP-dependent 6-phosphofructokinase [bacterium]|nr:ATP-dependent 6-phosphofructokinase [bacterium]